MTEIINLCRLCMSSGDNLVSIFERNGNTAKEIFQITGIMITELKNKATAMICNECLSHLSKAIQFRVISRKVDNFFKRSSKETIKWKEELKLLKKIPTQLKNEKIEEIKIEPCFILSDHDDGIIDFDDNFDQSSLKSSNVDDSSTSRKLQLPTTKQKVVKESIKCPLCPSIFNSRKSLQQHSREQHELTPLERYRCDHCNREYAYKACLAEHLRVKHFKEGKLCFKELFPCKVCGKLLSNKRSALRHFREVHINVKKKNHWKKKEVQKEFICPICAKMFKNRTLLTQHEKIHRVLKPSDYWYCDLCGNKFKEKTLMRVHIQNRHVRRIRFQCSQCEKNYTTKFHLDTHIKIIHDNIKDFQCEYCEKSFGNKKNLVSHTRVHTGETPFQCHICDRKFMHQTDFRRHKWGHTGHKSFRCVNCNQGFMKRAELQNHMNRCRAANY